MTENNKIEYITSNLPSILPEDNPEQYRLDPRDNSLVQVWGWMQYRKCYIWHNWLQTKNVHEAVAELVILDANKKKVIGLTQELVEASIQYFNAESARMFRYRVNLDEWSPYV